MHRHVLLLAAFLEAPASAFHWQQFSELRASYIQILHEQFIQRKVRLIAWRQSTFASIEGWAESTALERLAAVRLRSFIVGFRPQPDPSRHRRSRCRRAVTVWRKRGALQPSAGNLPSAPRASGLCLPASLVQCLGRRAFCISICRVQPAHCEDRSARCLMTSAILTPGLPSTSKRARPSRKKFRPRCLALV